MKLIIAGSRDLIVSHNFISECLRTLKLCTTDKFNDTFKEIVYGGARGIDSCGEYWASYYHLKTKLFNADWNKYKKAAGYIRNKEMAEYADALLLIWDGESKGSKNMKEEMKKLNKPIHEVILKRG